MNAKQQGLGEIHPQGAYPLKEFCRRTGISYQNARNYVPARKLANRAFVLGEDFVAHLREQPLLKPRLSAFSAEVPITQREPQEAA